VTVFVAGRVLRMLFTVWLIVTAVFFATRLSGDAIDFIGGEGIAPDARQALVAYYGLDQSMTTQYGRFLAAMLDGNFGLSLIERRPVTAIFLERIWPSLSLAAGAVAVTLLVGVPAGIVAAVWRGRLAGGVVMTAAFLGYAVPNFVLAILLLLVFSFSLNWLPSTGNGTPLHYVMPVLALSAFYIAGLTRFTRNAMLDVLHQDYMRTARAKGLPERTVILKHGFRNALVTVLSVLGLQVTALIASGSVTIETVFAWRGVGDLLVTAALRRDYPVLQFAVLALSCAVVVINGLTDIAYAAVDPRIRMGRT
jgi:ABC-type dipeptide/oligopeptide/nickel transport system permease component